MRTEIFEMTYDRQPWGTWVKVVYQDAKTKKTVTKKGGVHINCSLNYHDLGHAIRQLLNEKYEFAICSVFKPLKGKDLETAYIEWN